MSERTDVDAALTLDAALGKIANGEGESWVTLREVEAAALVTEIDRLNKLVPAHETFSDKPFPYEDIKHPLAAHQTSERQCVGCGASSGFTSPLNLCQKCERGMNTQNLEGAQQ